MKNFSSILLVSVLICCIFILPCSAHPGRTDSNGGHYNHDTGEYHYHNDGSPQNTPQYESDNSSSDEDDTVTTKNFAEWSEEKYKYSDSNSDYNNPNTIEEEEKSTILKPKTTIGKILFYILVGIIFVLLVFVVPLVAINIIGIIGWIFDFFSNLFKSFVSFLKRNK